MTASSPISHAFIRLGHFLRDFCASPDTGAEGGWDLKLTEAIDTAGHKNGWFTENNVMNALRSWGELLTQEHLKSWLSQYSLNTTTPSKTVAVIMAGNIPLVGFHDFMCVLLTGHKVVVRLSSNDAVLLPFIAEYLIENDALFADKIRFSEERLTDFDAVIATGSNNTSRYFDYYFGKYPHIIRKNRNSVAVLTGEETKEELNALGTDIFQYFGLGCRSVSKLFVPKGYDFSTFFEAIFDFQDITNNHKYANNYDYNKAVFLMSDYKILDNNFLLLKEDENYGSPIGTLFYEYYDNLEALHKKLEADTLELQCIVGKPKITNSLAFGITQQPSLTDYADNVDTIAFLLSL